ncbi:unnamed protein product [Linum trigynum]|uniref:Uncharacterized protein n=1 Tax=Linum trigynum TaxID=586398 RepID=A0AAV2CMS1_9ROSI
MPIDAIRRRSGGLDDGDRYCQMQNRLGGWRISLVVSTLVLGFSDLRGKMRSVAARSIGGGSDFVIYRRLFVQNTTLSPSVVASYHIASTIPRSALTLSQYSDLTRRRLFTTTYTPLRQRSRFEILQLLNPL